MHLGLVVADRRVFIFIFLGGLYISPGKSKNDDVLHGKKISF